VTVALTREQIVDTAQRILAEDGLGGLTMRRLAQKLGVQPGATYYHIANKQDLLVAVAERILNQAQISTADPARAALDIRAALLPIRDSADVVSFANAYRPEALVPFRTLEQLFGAGLSPQSARWAAQTLIHYVLGFVAHEQNQAELIRARILTPTQHPDKSEEAFRFGLAAILRGLPAPPRGGWGVARETTATATS
jgi:TetR/AcrR family transcriptional regulator, tetracycline repressor protein